MSNQTHFRDSFTSQYDETQKAATEIEKLAGALLDTAVGSSAEQQASDKLRQAYIDAGTNPRIKNETQQAVEVARQDTPHTFEGALILQELSGRGIEGGQDGCAAYALLVGKMTFDYFTKPDEAPLVVPHCADNNLAKLSVQVPYHYPYDGPKQSREIDMQK